MDILESVHLRTVDKLVRFMTDTVGGCLECTRLLWKDVMSLFNKAVKEPVYCCPVFLQESQWPLSGLVASTWAAVNSQEAWNHPMVLDIPLPPALVFILPGLY